MTQPPVAITTFEQLASADGTSVTVVGTYRLHDPVPHLKRDPPFYLSAIVLDGDPKPRLFLQQPRPAGEQQQLADKRVQVTGVFHRTQPRAPTDPPYSATFSGSWLFDITRLEPVHSP
jgi:hypothetical protein